jgi:polyphosphate kinase
LTPKNDYKFLNRDLSWLSFNHRVLQEAGRETVPLMEKIRFLSIYSSNLDEFYRVRMPALRALEGLSGKTETKTINRLLSAIHEKVIGQLKVFGTTLRDGVLPELRQQSIAVIYDQPIPEPIREPLETYFSHHVAAYIQVVNVSGNTHFFPENNKLYLVVSTGGSRKNRQLHIVKIPSDSLPRFYSVEHQGTRYIIFLDDIIKLNLARILGEKVVTCRSFKITRDAELDLQDEFAGNLAKKIEKKILQRDQGLATRFLYEPGMQKQTLAFLKDNLGLKSASFIQGGTYHNLKDLSSLPLKEPHFQYEPWTRLTINLQDKNKSLFDETVHRDILLHTPYHAYDTILRFFNEAAIDPAVTRIYVTLYRVASDSRIVNALISAAKNGKKVTVFVELKARFDEANNIRWSKKMKAAGVRIIESIPGLKVHAKLALVKRKNGERTQLLGLFATGNFNENTAHYYTDHILLTAAKPLLKEAEDLFRILRKGKKKKDLEKHKFDHLLVGQYNLQEHFIELIGREISNAKAGTPASIIIKFNNLEDKVLIENLYEASAAGVKISLIVRGICCLVPGVDGMSENITVRRIIDRYLEHGRVFIFHNNGDPEVYLGSADWMNRNIYRRIEVCFPVYEPELKKELMDIVDIQLKDNCQAVMIDELGNNLKIEKSVDEEVIRSQKEIGEMVGTLNKV